MSKTMIWKCLNCNNMFVNLSDEQIQLISKIREKGILELTVNNGEYYNPQKFESWFEVNQKYHRGATKKLLDLITGRQSDEYSNAFLMWELFILEHYTEKEEWERVKNNNLDDLKIRVIDYISFSDSFKIFENEFGKVNFISHKKYNELQKCPVCGKENNQEVYLTVESIKAKVLNIDEECQKNSKDKIEMDLKRKQYNVFIEILKEIKRKETRKKEEYEKQEIINQKNNELKIINQEIDNRSKEYTKCKATYDFELKEYIKLLIEYEKDKEILETILNKQIDIYCNQNFVFEKEKKSIGKHIENKLNNQINSLQKEIKILKEPFEIDEETLNKNNIIKPIVPEKPNDIKLNKPIKPELKKTGLFNKTRVAIENQNLLKEYELELTQYDNMIKEHEIEIKQYEILKNNYDNDYKKFQIKYDTLKEDIQKGNQCKILELQNKINEIEENKQNIDSLIKDKIDNLQSKKICDFMIEEIKLTKEKTINTNITLNQLMSLNIIYPKYNTMFAWTTIYEYLLTGRCEKLEGSTGAYNLYESELKSNLIIDKLDMVIDKLEDIKANQHQMYCVLQEINTIQNDINGKLDDVANDIENIRDNTTEIKSISSMIEYNTARTAYYSKINSKLLNDIKWITFIK